MKKKASLSAQGSAGNPASAGELKKNEDRERIGLTYSRASGKAEKT